MVGFKTRGRIDGSLTCIRKAGWRSIAVITLFEGTVAFEIVSGTALGKMI